jgi:protein-arginine kinase activator protein McsA
MICEKCKMAEATIHITEVFGHEMKKTNFCQTCFGQTDLAKKLSGKMPDATSGLKALAFDQPPFKHH